MTNRNLENDIAEIVRRTYGPLQRQASDGAAIVALAMFVATIALWVQIVGN